MNEETFKADLALFKVRAVNFMADFFLKWQSSFVGYKICFDDSQIDITSIKARIYTLSVNVIDVKTLIETRVVVTGNLDYDDEKYHRYRIKLMVNGNEIDRFKRPDFDINALANDFKTLYSLMLNYDTLDNQFNSFLIIFDEQSNIFSVCLFFTTLKNNKTYQNERLIYEAEDVIVLRNSNVMCCDFIHYWKFKFLWQFYKYSFTNCSSNFYINWK